jgi:hypothetical protein
LFNDALLIKVPTGKVYWSGIVRIFIAMYDGKIEEAVMSPELEDFRQRILAHAKLAVSRAPKIDSEAKTNASLVQPFLTALGYDC